MANIEAYFQPSGPVIDEDNAEWLHSMSWGGLPEDGDDFMEYMGWYALPKAEQRETAETFMTYPRARHMPAAVKDRLVALGLLGGGGHPRGEEASDGRE